MGALKKCIKEENKPAFDHVPAKALDCWKVSISDIHNLPENISDVQGVKEGPLSPMKRLMSVFSDVPKDEHIHIIVKPPTIGKCPLYMFLAIAVDDITLIPHDICHPRYLLPRYFAIISIRYPRFSY